LISQLKRRSTNWSKSEDPSAATEDTKRFDKDTELKAKLKETHKLADVKESDYDAVFYPGGHGPLWDLKTDKIQSL
jgi:putative intracellular protease/amidase